MGLQLLTGLSLEMSLHQGVNKQAEIYFLVFPIESITGIL